VSRFYKLGMVLAGYAVALLVTFAICTVLALVRHADSPRDASGGMQAFGDMLLFLGLFGFLALFPTTLALYFLRPFEKFWNVFSAASLALAATGPVAALMMGRAQKSPELGLLMGLFGLLKVLGAPVLGAGFLICAAFAPIRRPRWVLLAAAGIEFSVGAYAFFCLLVLGHWAI
jgi:hypothetical protein